MRLVDVLTKSANMSSWFPNSGTLAIGARGEARYFGQTARGEVCYCFHRVAPFTDTWQYLLHASSDDSGSSVDLLQGTEPQL